MTGVLEKTGMFGYFKGSLLTTIGACLLGYYIGGATGAAIVMILGILEVSLSFDNAVVNAKILDGFDDVWRHRFINWGMPIAVFGMRFIFPLAIVAIVAGLGPIEVFDLALYEPARYAEILGSAHIQISGFGGAFLMMVFLKFFCDEEKETHWLWILEAPLTKLGKLEAVQVMLVITILSIVSSIVDPAHQMSFLVSGLIGLIMYILVDGLGGLIGDGDTMVKQGVAGFLYLEVLDASFSFDGVIGAFAITDNIFTIMLGLGVGAMFVRSLTLMLVDKGTLQEFKYLEHGAFWGIGALATIMLVGVEYEVPEIVTGLIGAGAIIAALISSIVANRKSVEV